MTLTRRSFLKALGIGAVAVAVNPLKTLETLSEPKRIVPEFGRFESVRFIETENPIKWRKYESLPAQTAPLCEGIVPSGRALNVKWVTVDEYRKMLPRNKYARH